MARVIIDSIGLHGKQKHFDCVITQSAPGDVAIANDIKRTRMIPMAVNGTVDAIIGHQFDENAETYARNFATWVVAHNPKLAVCIMENDDDSAGAFSLVTRSGYSISGVKASTFEYNCMFDKNVTLYVMSKYQRVIDSTIGEINERKYRPRWSSLANHARAFNTNYYIEGGSDGEIRQKHRTTTVYAKNEPVKWPIVSNRFDISIDGRRINVSRETIASYMLSSDPLGIGDLARVSSASIKSFIKHGLPRGVINAVCHGIVWGVKQ